MNTSGVERDVEKVLSALQAVKRLNEGVAVSNTPLDTILEAAKLESSKASFQEFSAAMMAKVTGCFSHFGSVSPHLAKVRAHRDFHRVRPQVPGMWSTLVSKLGVLELDAHNIQSVFRVLFEQSMSELFGMLKKPEHSTCERTLLADEENAIHYASGYIAMKLFKKFQKVSGKRATSYRECLSHMAICGDESSFYQYTMEWIHSVNRGGLFIVNDSTFRLFKFIELRTQQLLPMHLRKESDTSKEDIIRKIVDDENVQMEWSGVAIDVRDEKDADDLLYMIVEKWITIRGFSLTSTWTEEYKRAKDKTVQKAKSLCSELKMSD